MQANVEIKAIARRFEQQRAIAESLADGPAKVFEQQDTFFRVPHGRLKLRQFGDGRAELIQYERPDTAAATTVPPARLRRSLRSICLCVFID